MVSMPTRLRQLYERTPSSSSSIGKFSIPPASDGSGDPTLIPNAGGMENFPIEELELGVRSYNCLKRVGIETIGDLVTKSESELAAIPNFGKKSIEEVKETLQQHGLTLRGGSMNGLEA